MTDKKFPALTKEQARFLMDLDLSTFSKKVDAIERAKHELHFKNDDEKEVFYTAVEIGFWDITSDFVVINPLLPFDQRLFVAKREESEVTVATPLYYLTSKLEEAHLFVGDKISSTKEVAMYDNDAFILKEYDAVKKYGNVREWLLSGEELVESKEDIDPVISNAPSKESESVQLDIETNEEELSLSDAVETALQNVKEKTPYEPTPVSTSLDAESVTLKVSEFDEKKDDTKQDEVVEPFVEPKKEPSVKHAQGEIKLK